MKISREEENGHGKFFIEKDGKTVAVMTYTIAGDHIMIIEHTEVDRELRGQNIGLELVNAAAGVARDKERKILPLCPFAKKLMEKNKDKYADVLSAGN